MENTSLTPPAATHTPTPWEVDQHEDQYGSYRVIQAEDQLRELFQSGSYRQHALARQIDRENVAFIRRACNAHDVLLETCEWLISELCQAWDEPRENAIPAHVLEAIAQAKGR